VYTGERTTRGSGQGSKCIICSRTRLEHLEHVPRMINDWFAEVDKILPLAGTSKHTEL